jgi:hypothetical protein
MPIPWAAARMVVPDATLVFIPSIVKLTMYETPEGRL